MESTRPGINNETIDSLNSFALTIYKIIEVITEHERAFYFVLFIIFLIFVYFFTKLILGFVSQRRVDKSIDKNSDLLDKVIQALTAFNENIKTLKK